MAAMIGLAIQEWGLRRLDGLAMRFGPRSALPAHLETGLRGEREALFALRRAGYTVVAQRWTSARVAGDLDLVAWHANVLCFIEVKSRTARAPIAAEVAVDPRKREQLRQLARMYLKGFDEKARAGIPTRFDVVSVYLLPTGVQSERIENAFGWHERHPTRNSGSGV